MDSNHPTAVSSHGLRFPSTSDQASRYRRDRFSENQSPRNIDLMERLRGMYRLLTLYQEQGSGGVVDKILIAQESLANLMNKLVPRSYTSITKIDFTSLDQTLIQPLGVYGDKTALTAFLHKVINIDDDTAAHLISSTNATSRLNFPTLASGLYFLLPDKEPHSTNETSNNPAFVIYWPEDTTWNDNAIGAVRRNRTTFMRYLTKLTPQIRCLISKELADNIVWKGADEERDDFDDGEESDGEEMTHDDRCFRFNVSKPTEQEEGADIYPGFEFAHSAIKITTTPPDATIPEHITSSPIETKSIFGNCKQGFLASKLVSRQGGSRDLTTQSQPQSIVGLFMEYTVYLLALSEADKAELKNDPLFIPRPQAFSATTFSLPVLDSIRHIQAIGNKFLLIVDQPSGIAIWLNDCSRIGRGAPLKHFPISQRRYHFAVHEQQRLLAIAYIESTGQIYLHLQSMDETFTSLLARGPPQNVTAWYQDSSPDITHVCFASGYEEICLVERSGRVRVYSFVSQGFRASNLQLPPGISVLSALSAPDDSALIIVEKLLRQEYRLRLYHWSSFGQFPDGIILEFPGDMDSVTSFFVASILERNRIAIIAVAPRLNTIKCFNLQIKMKRMPYCLEQKAGKRIHRSEPTFHNSLIDCHADVWTRYPVIPAIKRNTISDSNEIPPSLTFVCGLGCRLLATYFKRMIKDFEWVTKKPTDRVLDAIEIRAGRMEDLDWETLEARSFKAGEWFVELLCLIPIHIAVARYNSFIPLKDGVLDPIHEQRLSGATVDQIADAITLGWYESIINSYMATKPVKVVSCMGEQSVGKSFTLNHIVDSSFAGSALRTTEGVWLSVCPTRDTLVVALDFEGVHSIETSPQEDTLLVLFNTAISNLVLFRNNFALSRDVGHMFTSFQAAALLLNPAANPKLFKGLLAIIVKDVVEGDKKEIVKEFFSKLQQIVSDEQENNFITLLHDSQLRVFPWPVIQSRPFYDLFSRPKNLLFRQPMTHATAGEFLFTLKTLMAKLKARDWGPIEQNLIKYRVALLSAILPSALATGYANTGAEREELKNLDTQEVIPWEEDSANVIFSLSGSSADQVEPLRSLIDRWNPDAARRHISVLSKYLEKLVSARMSRIRAWLHSNISRFPTDSTDVRSLKGILADKEDLLMASIQLCKIKCSDCYLPCMLPKAHDPVSHDCRTSHQCLAMCDYGNEHIDDTRCGLLAGHGWPHLCNPTSHSCGQRCQLAQYQGCQMSCIGSPEHRLQDGHLCSTRSHQCGMPCDLKGLKVANARGDTILYSCPNICSVAYDADHSRHVCGDRLTCPITCQLCNRLCTKGNHLHGLLDGEIHLCGRVHICRYECESPGICEVNTDAERFVGSIQLNQYTRVISRLHCAVPILPGDLVHAGPHTHSTNPDTVHFCDAMCNNCGYTCHLPLHHVQREHETSHGLVRNTIWVVKDRSDAQTHVRETLGEAEMSNTCGTVCSQLGRHVHMDYCRSRDASCQGHDSSHISERMLPDPEIPKDWISHKLFWARTGFKDPYSQEEQAEFSRCDAQCAGAEHRETATAPSQPSFCTLPIFHPPQTITWISGGNGYVSTDGHSYTCPNPNNAQSNHR